MSEETSKRTNPVLLLSVALVLAAACWCRERICRIRAESACRATVGLSVAVATAPQGVDDETLRELAAIGGAGRRRDFRDCMRRADALATDLVTEAPLFADAEVRTSARRFFRKQKTLAERFADIVRRGRSAEREGRDAASIRHTLQVAFGAAAKGDAEGVGKALADADEALERLPRRSRQGRGAARWRGASPADTTRKILLECEHPGQVAEELMTEGSEAAAKVRVAAAFLLADGEAESALWLAETAAFLLGLRAPAEASSPTLPTPLEPVPELPEVDPDGVRGWLSTGEALLQGREAAGLTVAPADTLLDEGARFLDAGETAVAGVLAQAALNVLGMSDHAIRQMTGNAGDGDGGIDPISPKPGAE